MREAFDTAFARAEAALKPGEVLLANFAGEVSDFVRFNRSAVRQPGRVEDMGLSLRLIRGRRQAEAAVTLTGTKATDGPVIDRLVGELRDALDDAEDDPHLLYNETPRTSLNIDEGRLPALEEAIAAVAAAGQGRDLVGFYQGGRLARGFANSLGQHNWREADSFTVDYSLYTGGDKAVKTGYAGSRWDNAAFGRSAAEAAAKLDALKRPPRTVPAGEYRTYLPPAAMEEILSLANWGGFSLQGRRTGASCFQRLIERGETLSPMVSVHENIAEGIAPDFQADGFLRPGLVTLIDRGRIADPLVSPRSAAEYGAQTNGANGGEATEALDMAPGDMAIEDALARLGTGVAIGNLWYLNYSDRAGGRITGLTRFATFWVEGGEIVAPLAVMRFDDTLSNIFGAKLEALTAEREFRPDPSTYDRRSTESMRLPGALLSHFRLSM